MQKKGLKPHERDELSCPPLFPPPNPKEEGDGPACQRLSSSILGREEVPGDSPPCRLPRAPAGRSLTVL